MNLEVGYARAFGSSFFTIIGGCGNSKGAGIGATSIILGTGGLLMFSYFSIISAILIGCGFGGASSYL